MAPQDGFIDEDDECCPLCVEEFDLSDKNFRPCPCGYQVCQFCFNNIKNNMNGLCPACRRPYNDETIQWKVVTQEEIAQFKANVQKNAKKKADQRQKELQKREVESLNRKHLAGLRVVQKNLVYVIGLSPGVEKNHMLDTLRGDQYFGQYGKIIKIAVGRGKPGDPPSSSPGVYVTFARKEDAARCIAAVNGSQNGERVLRAQLGTTKYCSAYLRNETCTNNNCMFLHEPGDNENSYSRQDLSSINSVSTQRPLAAMTSAASSSRQTAQTQPPISQAQPLAAASQLMAREDSKDGSDSGDGSALPSSASWANRGLQQRSRRGSQATSGAASSPAISQAIPVVTAAIEESPTSAQDTAQSTYTASALDVMTFQESHHIRSGVMLGLLKALSSPMLTLESSSIDIAGDSISKYPPLFDDNGGERRRNMREHQEEARLHLELESQADSRSIPELAEEDEPESGSLQLGGEPEDRDASRESNSAQFQRRQGSQLPIQRGSNSGPFGPSLTTNFQQNASNLNSINGRTLTPQQQQQLLMLKSQPQSSFTDQFPSGVGTQSSQGSGTFHQQGHNRQSSRYTFANDSSAANSIKPSANPKLMAQQSSMMPSGSHGHQGTQFYASSMPGPPPGLKSSGTPPISGMFGQSQFVGSMGSTSAFSGTKDNSEVLREMLRGRGPMGGNQPHETGKREYFPSFLQQYPSTSSTPAPAPGLQASSLYRHQTGGFFDFSQKQKKKGKKHRHANTSSSGGGGLVDLADPSILQARMQHQQQSNAGAGQGLFGGQVQDDQGLPSLDDATLEVDALVAEDEFGAQSQDPFGSSVFSRSSTPSVPPGFEYMTHAHPPSAIREDSKSASRMTATSAEFTPGRGRLSAPLAQLSLPPSPNQTVIRPNQGTPTSKAKQDLKALATHSGLSKAIASQSSHTTLHSEDFPALETGKEKRPSSSSPAKASKVALVTTNRTPSTISASTVQTTPSSSKAAYKRGDLGNFSGSIPNKPVINNPIAVDTSTKAPVAMTDFPPLKNASVQSPVARNTPKTLRIASSPKTETPVGGSQTPFSGMSVFSPNLTNSRQPSLASIPRIDRPGTPTSEIISDNASITSPSISRASSPPPTKVGSAPVRATTKSMQKKQRREAQKVKERVEAKEVAASVVKAVPEPEIAPIMGRKKKQKKDRIFSSATANSTPTASRAPSPGPDTLKSNSSTEQVIDAAEKPTIESGTNTPAVMGPEQKLKGKVKAQPLVTPSPEPAAPVVEPGEDVSEKRSPTPLTAFRSLQADGYYSNPGDISFFKNPNSSFKHQDMSIDLQNANQKLTITPEDRALLLSGRPVHKVVEGPNRIMLTPNGDCVRNLTEEEEQRYLELQTSLANETSPTAFVSTKSHGGNGFTLLGGRAVPNGPPSFFPLQAESTPLLDPVAKIQRDEALSYINQYVLPSLSTNSQLEKALNANALDTEILRGDESSWLQWSNNPNAPRPGNVDNVHASSHNHNGILATGLETMTAHFGIGKDIDRGQPLGNVTLLSLGDAESAMQAARKETEVLEKKLNALLKKNRRLLLGSGH